MLICIQAAEEEVLVPKPDPISTVLPDVLLPMTPVLVEPDIDPVPTPKPTATVISKLPVNTWYFIESKERLVIYDSPEGFVAIKEYDFTDKNTITILGVFADGNGKPDEERTYPSNQDYKYAYSIRAVKAGTPELLLIPAGAVDKTKTIRQTIIVSGLGPLPPPIPVPVPPDVDPVPVPDPSPTGIKVLLLYNENASRDQLNTVNSTKIVQWMNTNCSKTEAGTPIWRRWDRTSVTRTGVANETDTVQKLWAAVQPFITQDNMIFVATDKKIHPHLMTTPEDTLLFLQQVKDGKL